MMDEIQKIAQDTTKVLLGVAKWKIRVKAVHSPISSRQPKSKASPRECIIAASV